MPNPLQSQTFREIYSLVQNAKQLVITHHERAFAEDVLRATAKFMESKKIKFDSSIFEDLIVSLRDKNIQVLCDKFDLLLKQIISCISRQ